MLCKAFFEKFLNLFFINHKNAEFSAFFMFVKRIKKESYVFYKISLLFHCFYSIIKKNIYGDFSRTKKETIGLNQKEAVLTLASASPRRREILTEGGIPHVVKPADVDESVFEGIEPRLMVQLLAASKAAAVASTCDGMVLGADTVVVSGGCVLGKPADEEDAFEMLSALSGKTHSVYTGIALLRGSDGRMLTHCEETKVTFRPLSDEEIYA